MSTLDEIMADPRVGGLRPLGGGAYEMIPADRCPCGAFSRDSIYHQAECTDWVIPEEYR